MCGGGRGSWAGGGKHRESFRWVGQVGKGWGGRLSCKQARLQHIHISPSRHPGLQYRPNARLAPEERQSAHTYVRVDGWGDGRPALDTC